MRLTANRKRRLLLALGLSLFSIGKQSGLNINFEEVVVVATPSLTGYKEVKKGVFLAENFQNEFHSLAATIPLFPDAYYRIRYDILQLPREKVTVTTDLYAPGYDNPEQELSKIFDMNDLGKRQDFIFNLGNSPEHAYFRVLYSGPPGLKIANIEITRVPAWLLWLKRGLWAGIFGTLLIMAMFAIIKFRNFSVTSQQHEVNSSRILGAELPAVVAIYLAAVLIRFSIYIIMPYWSGDEYAFKSIAAGIWHFGHHGVLTDSMISHSVD